MLAVVAILVFSVAYAWAAQRYAMAGAMLCAVAFAVFCVSLSMLLRQQPPVLGFSCAFICALLVQLGMKRMLSMSKTLAASKV